MHACACVCMSVLDPTDTGSLMSVYPQLCVCQQFGDNKVSPAQHLVNK